jgi:hypothetical protein
LGNKNNNIDRRVGILINFTSTTQYALTSGDLGMLIWQELFVVIWVIKFFLDVFLRYIAQNLIFFECKTQF